MVPMRGFKTGEPAHEPEGRAALLRSRRERLDAAQQRRPTSIDKFIVAMRAQFGVSALQERTKGIIGKARWQV